MVADLIQFIMCANKKRMIFLVKTKIVGQFQRPLFDSKNRGFSIRSRKNRIGGIIRNFYVWLNFIAKRVTVIVDV